MELILYQTIAYCIFHCNDINSLKSFLKKNYNKYNCKTKSQKNLTVIGGERSLKIAESPTAIMNGLFQTFTAVSGGPSAEDRNTETCLLGNTLL